MTEREVYHRVMLEIGKVSPPGLGNWSLTHQLVSDLWDSLFDAVAQWRKDINPRTQRLVNLRVNELVQAYRDAGELFLLVEGQNKGRTPHAVV